MVEYGNKRIIFIDLMRALAVVMMVQGHTVDSFLMPVYRNPDSPVFGIWNYLRGFTAPIFMFSAGVVFTYLFYSKNLEFKNNPRVKKGIKRFFLLILLAYFLRFPTYHIFVYSNVTIQQWFAFYTVDTLHCIAFGLLFIISLAYICEKFKLNNILVFSSAAAFFVFVHLFIENINWNAFMHPFFSGYFFAGNGSFFPLFPFTAYVLGGAALGSYIARHREFVNSPKFGLRLLLIGFSIFVFGHAVEFIKNLFDSRELFWVDALNLFTLRIFVVLALNGLMSIIALRINRVPKLIRLYGTHSLAIYVVHLIILFGNTWIPGLSMVIYQKFDLPVTLIFVAGMFTLMSLMVLTMDYIKIHTRSNAVIITPSITKFNLVEK